MSNRFVRVGPCPEKFSLHMVLRKQVSPAVAEWVWQRPYAAQEILRLLIEGAIRDGTLERIENEVKSHVDGTNVQP